MNSVTEDYSKHLEEVRKYVRAYFNDITNNKLLYHNLVHTKSVAEAATQIAEHYKLRAHDNFTVITAAWFHDIGYFTVVEHHEQKGADIAENFLKDKGISGEIIDGVKECILATRMPQQPKNLMEQIICDADLFHLGTDDFAERNKLLHKEVEAIQGQEIKKKVWREQTIKLLTEHHYFTDYCNDLLGEKKKTNLLRLQSKQSHDVTVDAGETKITAVKKNHHDKKHEEKEELKLEETQAKDAPASRGIQTMFRIVSSNNQRLSVMADNKAHIMITVNSIILSIILGVLLRKLEPDNSLVYPSILFIAVSLFAIIFAILATRPSIPNGTFTEEDITDKKVNLLFFGNFYKMSLEEYTNGMYKVMEDRKFLYGTLIKDVYIQGAVLGKKYFLLRISYNIFMYGLSASVMAYVVALLFFSPILQTTLLTGVAPVNPTEYHLSHPERVTLPAALNEASGIAFYKGSADTIYTQEDEKANLFHFKMGDKNEMISKFGKKGDYEDIAICNDYVILLRSDGVLFTFPFAQSYKATVDTVNEWKNLMPDGEYESLGAVESTHQLYALCKHSKDGSNDKCKGYIFNIAENGSIVANGKFEVNVKEIEAKSGDKKLDFRPTGMALNPCTNEWYIISSINKLLVVTDSDWKVKEVYPLKPAIFRQPEGIAFDNDCNLYISNEKSEGTQASIMKFVYE